MNPKQMCEAYGIQPRKSLGQNFMHDPNSLEKIISTADIMPDDTVLEIGAGTGELTARLMTMARHVMAIEIDQRLEPLLSERFADAKNVYFVFQDVLKTDILGLIGMRNFLVVANVPYYITTAILQHLLEQPRRPQRIVMTMQYEVAQRITARVGDMSLLAVSVQFYGDATIASKLNPAVFWPRPNIDSAILRVDTFDKPRVDVPSERAFFRVVKAGFSQKRKQLRNALSGGLQQRGDAIADHLAQANIDPTRRAETLSLEEWARLTHVMTSAGVVPA